MARIIDDIIYVIPARSGSKGVKDKNIRQLGERNLIEIAVDCIQEHDKEAKIIVNSDSTEYLNAVRRNVIKYCRPKYLANDDTLMCDVLNEMQMNCDLYKKHNFVSIVQPTCPFRLPEHFERAEKKLIANSHETLTSVTKVEDAHPARMYTRRGNVLTSLNRTMESANRQNLTDVYHRNGLIYITNKTTLSQNRILDDCPGFIEIEREFTINIDDEFDWKLASALFNSI